MQNGIGSEETSEMKSSKTPMEMPSKQMAGLFMVSHLSMCISAPKKMSRNTLNNA